VVRTKASAPSANPNRLPKNPALKCGVLYFCGENPTTDETDYTDLEKR
jgi:hypothetical protein